MKKHTMKDYFLSVNIYDIFYFASFGVLFYICMKFYEGFNSYEIMYPGLLIESVSAFILVKLIENIKEAENKFISIIILIFFIGGSLTLSFVSTISNFMNATSNLSIEKQIDNTAYSNLESTVTTLKSDIENKRSEILDLKKNIQDQKLKNYSIKLISIGNEQEQNRIKNELKPKENFLNELEKKLIETQEKLSNTPKKIKDDSPTLKKGNEKFVDAMSKITKLDKDTISLILGLFIAIIFQIMILFVKWEARKQRLKHFGEIKETPYQRYKQLQAEIEQSAYNQLITKLTIDTLNEEKHIDNTEKTLTNNSLTNEKDNLILTDIEKENNKLDNKIFKDDEIEKVEKVNTRKIKIVKLDQRIEKELEVFKIDLESFRKYYECMIANIKNKNELIGYKKISELTNISTHKCLKIYSVLEEMRIIEKDKQGKKKTYLLKQINI